MPKADAWEAIKGWGRRKNRKKTADLGRIEKERIHNQQLVDFKFWACQIGITRR
jgi:hypothetical protein